MFEHEHGEVVKAGWIYLVATHIGTAFLLALFVLLGKASGSMDFADFHIPTTGPVGAVMFLLAVIGFGTKAGFVPMHVWLPEAHPAAPSFVSAVMSGVMIKTGIYGLLRIVTWAGTEVAPPPLHTWLPDAHSEAPSMISALFAGVCPVPDGPGQAVLWQVHQASTGLGRRV